MKPEMIRVYDGTPVPYSEKQFRLDILPAQAPKGHLPNDFLAQWGIYRPTVLSQPTITETQISELADMPTENPDGSWSYKWSVRDKTAEELAQDHEHIIREKHLKIKIERDRRLEADFEFMGKMYQRDAKSLQRITGASTLAGFAIAEGAQFGDLRWENPNRDFGWIASDDTVTPMDAYVTFTFGQAAAEREMAIVFAAKKLREMAPILEDYTDDRWWP
jgi:hypothetical protein